MLPIRFPLDVVRRSLHGEELGLALDLHREVVGDAGGGERRDEERVAQRLPHLVVDQEQVAIVAFHDHEEVRGLHRERHAATGRVPGAKLHVVLLRNVPRQCVLGTLVEAPRHWALAGPKPAQILVLLPLAVLLHVAAPLVRILAAHQQALYNLLHCNVPVIPYRLRARRASLPNPLTTRPARRMPILTLPKRKKKKTTILQFRVSQKKLHSHNHQMQIM